MRKLMILLLASLLLFSFTSCEKDKTDEVVQTYLDFVDTSSLASDLVSCFDDVIKEDTDYSTTPINLETSTDQLDFSPIMERFVSIEDKQKINVTKVEAKGTISGTTVGKEDVTFNNTSYTITYKVLSADDKEVKTNQTLSLTLSGSYKMETTKEAGLLSASFTLNGVNYEISYSKNLETYKFITASVNGKDVNLTLLNAQIFPAM